MHERTAHSRTPPSSMRVVSRDLSIVGLDLIRQSQSLFPPNRQT